MTIGQDELKAVEEIKHDSSIEEDEHAGSREEEETYTDDEEYEGSAFIQDVLCSIQDKPAIPRSWILLNS